MTLQDFFNDKEILKEVQTYLDSFLEQEAVRLLFEAERDTVDDDYLRALSHTKDGLLAAFENLELAFQTKVKQGEKVINNAAR